MIRNHDHDRQRHFEWTLDSAEFGKALVRLQLILLAHTLDSDVQAARPFPNEPPVFPWESEKAIWETLEIICSTWSISISRYLKQYYIYLIILYIYMYSSADAGSHPPQMYLVTCKCATIKTWFWFRFVFVESKCNPKPSAPTMGPIGVVLSIKERWSSCTNYYELHRTTLNPAFGSQSLQLQRTRWSG